MNAQLEMVVSRLAMLGIDPRNVEVMRTRCQVMRLGLSDAAGDGPEVEVWTIRIHDKHGVNETAPALAQALARIETRLEGAKQP